MMLKSFNAQKAINAAVGAEYSAFMRRPTHLEGGTVYTVPAVGNVLSLPCERKNQRGALRSRLLPHDAWVIKSRLDSGKRRFPPSGG